MDMQETKFARPNINVGVVGCGNISPVYLENIRRNFSDVINLVACSDLSNERAVATSKKFDIPKVLDFPQLLQDPEVELVLNLTNPLAHASVNLKALEAGKHVYSEKPLAIELKDGRRIINKAISSNLMVGCAPDTVLSPGLQTCRKIIDEGIIGEPVSAIACFGSHGVERWHPNPEFYYKKGGGPMFDIGPYYLSTLVNLLGPVKRVTGSHARMFPQRIAGDKKIDVEVSTHVVGLLDFESGAIGNITTSFDMWGPTRDVRAHTKKTIEIYGTEGTLTVPDPVHLGGRIRLLTMDGDKEMEWIEMPLAYDEIREIRGMGLVEMVWAIKQQRTCRVNGNVANHVLEIMHAVHKSSDIGRHIELDTTCERPDGVPTGLPKGVFDR